MSYFTTDRDFTQPSDSTTIPVRFLAVATSLACLFSLLLSHIGGEDIVQHEATTGTVLGQNIWNAAQVGFLLLLLCLWQCHRTWQFSIFAGASLLSLPFALYVNSPGATFCAALLFVACATAWNAPDLNVDIAEAPAGRTSPFVKFAFLAFACNLGSSMYNFAASRELWPYWHSIFDLIARLIGFTPDLPAIAEAMYTLGLEGVGLPASVNPGREASNLGTLVFAHIWTVLPALYTLYFLAMMKLAKDSPGTLLQRALCLYGIFHFLFLTDFVDYRYGRGYMNPAAHWLHWNEVFVWRIAILLPVYQKITTRMWKDGNGTIGVVMHYVLTFWAIGFLVHEVILLDLYRFTADVMGFEFHAIKFFGVRPKELGYNGALIFMVFIYGFTTLKLRCKLFRVTITGKTCRLD